MRYREEILEQFVRLFRDAVDSEFLLMYNNARTHWAQLVGKAIASRHLFKEPSRSCFAAKVGSTAIWSPQLPIIQNTVRQYDLPRC
ncbi:hypothetical protein TNCV_586581 [Trichonephila clavipes]|nr:hypothetical protein TNCV_586581 [Trichonephila clavipes]